MGNDAAAVMRTAPPSEHALVGCLCICADGSPYKRGLVRDVGAGKGRAPIEFVDEGGVVSFRLNVNQLALGKLAIFAMPPVDSLGNCVVDWRGPFRRGF